VIHDRMPSHQIQGQDHEGPKVEKMASFKVYLLCCMYVIKRLNGEF